MASRKKERAVKGVYMVFEYEDGGPLEVILPDGRKALLIAPDDMYTLDRVFVGHGLVRNYRGGKFELLDDQCDTLEKGRAWLEEDYDLSEVKKMNLEIRPTVSFS